MCSLHLTHPSAHTHLEQWAADCAVVDFLSEPGFEPTTLVTSGFKSNALSIRPTTANNNVFFTRWILGSDWVPSEMMDWNCVDYL